MPITKIYEGRDPGGLIRLPPELKDKYFEVYVIVKGKPQKDIHAKMIPVSEERMEQLKAYKKKLQGRALPDRAGFQNHITYDTALEKLLSKDQLIESLE
jgi:hypothetical protein